MRLHAVAAVLCLAGCSTGPAVSETERELVLQYVGSDAGTSGPFSKKTKQELAILGEKDRLEANALLDRGAVAFLVYSKSTGASATAKSPARTRVVVVQNGRVVGDYLAP